LPNRNTIVSRERLEPHKLLLERVVADLRG
jgi:hypothetical protein